MPKVSVIVPIYKVEKYLIQCVDSILNQTLKDIEVILVDEGDLDECRAIIDMYEFGAKKDARVKAIHEKNGGYGASVNKGFDVAVGEYISIIESDDFIEPTMLEEMYNYAKKLDADVVKTPYYEYWDKTNIEPERKQICFWYGTVKNVPENVTFKIEDYPELVAIHPSIWAALYKTNYIKEKNIRCIEAKGAGYVDNHFRLQTLCQTDKIAWLNRPLNYYRLSNPNASATLYNLGNFIQRWNDVHKLFREQLVGKWEILAPYCIIEEWINVYQRIICEGFTISAAQYDLVLQNLTCTTHEQIKKCPYFSASQRSLLLKYKSNPELFKDAIGSDISNQNGTGYITKCKVYFCGIPILRVKQKGDKWYKVYLFGFIPFLKLAYK